ncbi:MAG: N-6 DNA methylase [Acidobacteria bacterium]|nr:N-6 DNA methylase [Acidobacteriota bacterium]
MTVPGISGRLLPARFIAEQIAPGATGGRRTQAGWERWWREVERTCGPATGVRTLFDVAAMPLFGRLGYRTLHPQFTPQAVCATLLTPRGRPIALVVRNWARRPSSVWREATAAARYIGAAWCFVLAPPTLSILPAHSHTTRRSLDLALPLSVQSASLGTFLALATAASFDVTPKSTLDHWISLAATYQARVRSDLQHGVLDALGELSSVLSYRQGEVSPRDEALTIVYRVLFLLFAESRNLVPQHHPIYREAYTLSSLCDAALHTIPARGVWDGLAAISRLSRHGGQVDTLKVFPFNGHLFSAGSAPSLESTRNGGRPTSASDARDLAVSRSLIALGTRREPSGRVRISYAELGVEELGAVYERVLEVGTRGQSHARKDTGTFYTPQALADFVVHRTLSPLVAHQSADRILSLRVLDPAMGSGAFLVAALRFLTDAYERALVREGRCGPSDITAADRARFRRNIAQQCLFGVDLNPVAVQVARLSLWLATLTHARPLSFLDHRLRQGNSLIGATPADIERAPGAAIRTLPLFDTARSHLEGTLRAVLPTLTDIFGQPDDTVTDVRRKEAAWADLRQQSHPLSRWQLAVSLWCAQWLWPKDSRCPSPAEIRIAAHRIASDHRVGNARGQRTVSDAMALHIGQWATVARQMAAQHQMFHWPLEFPDVFYDTTGAPRRDAGFDAVIGNPPWEMIRRDATSGRRGCGRDPVVAFVRGSGLFPLCQRGHLNLYQPFVERSLSLARPGGRVGLIVPWGFAVDDGASALRSALFEAAAVDAVVGFDNARGLFPIHRGLRFAVVVAQPRSGPRDARATFGITTTEEIETLTTSVEEPLPIRLGSEDLMTVGGPTLRIPDLRQADDLEWLLAIMRAHPALGATQGWQAQFSRELNATDDRDSFKDRRGATRIPVAGGKHIEPFRVRINDCGQFMGVDAARRRLPDLRFTKPRLVYRDVSGVGNRFTLIAAVMPGDVVTTHTLFCLRKELPVQQQHFLCGVFNSRLMNRVVRLLMGGHVTTSLVEHLPVPCWQPTRCQRRIATIAAALAGPGLTTVARARLITRLNVEVDSLYL